VHREKNDQERDKAQCTYWLGNLLDAGAAGGGQYTVKKVSDISAGDGNVAVASFFYGVANYDEDAMNVAFFL
jgi:hypothetical protein